MSTFAELLQFLLLLIGGGAVLALWGTIQLTFQAKAERWAQNHPIKEKRRGHGKDRRPRT